MRGAQSSSIPIASRLADIWELFSRDMHGKALLCRVRPGVKELPAYRASSVMVLDNAKLPHWDAEAHVQQAVRPSRSDYLTGG